jgi:hypothetical protein
MTKDQLFDNIDMIVDLYYSNPKKDTDIIRNILRAHGAKNVNNIKLLYRIYEEIKACELGKIGRILILEKKPIICGICGRDIIYKDLINYSCSSKGNYNIDHAMPKCAGGSDTFANLQYSHCICNSVKGERTDLLSFYNNSEREIADYVYSETYLNLINEIKAKTKELNKFRTRKKRGDR